MEEEGIIGKFFITHDDKGVVDWQGRIESHIGMEYFMVQVFNKAPEKGMFTYHVVELSDMKGWMLFQMDDQMRTVFELYSK